GIRDRNVTGVQTCALPILILLDGRTVTEAVAHLTSELKYRYRLLSEIARRRGFFWGSFEIYGGLSGFLDLGPLGTGLKREIEDRSEERRVGKGSRWQR